MICLLYFLFSCIDIMVDQKINSLSRMYVCIRVAQNLCFPLQDYLPRLVDIDQHLCEPFIDFHWISHRFTSVHPITMANQQQFARLGRPSLGPAFLLGGMQQGAGMGSVAGGSLPPQFPRGRIASNTPGPTRSRQYTYLYLYIYMYMTRRA